MHSRDLLRLALAPDSEAPSAELRAKCIRCALLATSPNVRAVQIRTDGMGNAHSHPDGPHFGLLEAPRPVTRRGLYVFLHEAAHFHLHVEDRNKPQHIRELEAEKFAIARMRAAGIKIPPEELFLARENVRAAALRDSARGIRIEPRARRFVFGWEPKNFRLLLRYALAGALLFFLALTLGLLCSFANSYQSRSYRPEPTLPTHGQALDWKQLERQRYFEQYIATHPLSSKALDELNRGAAAQER